MTALPPEWDALPLNDFERLLVRGALRVAGDAENPIRGNMFAGAFRELLTSMLHRLAPDEDVQACCWFEQASNTNGPTRAQRAKFTAHGGLPDDLIEGAGYDVGSLVRPIVESIKRRNGYVHVRPGRVLVDEAAITQLRDDILAALQDLDEALRICRDAVAEVVREEVDAAAIGSLTEEVLDEVDILSTRHQVEHVEYDDFEVSRIGSSAVELIAKGYLEIELQYGSMSDLRRGDGAKMNVDFPFAVTLTALISDMKQLFVAKREVDTSSWYGPQDHEEIEECNTALQPRSGPEEDVPF